MIKVKSISTTDVATNHTPAEKQARRISTR
jgi:hypothetical protein